MVTQRALLLRRTPFGESSLVVRLFTPDLGRVDLVAKGAYRMNSRFFAVLDWFHTLEVQFTPKALGLAPLASADWALRRGALAARPAAYRAGLTVLELCDAAARHGQPEPELFAQAEATLQHLHQGGLPAALDQVLFELRFLELLGIAPALAECAACGGPAPVLRGVDRVAFSAGSGGRLCAACAETARRSGMRVGTMPEAVLEAALMFPARPRNVLALAPPEPELLGRIQDLTGRYLDYHLESRLRSQHAFLSESNRNAPERGQPPRLGPVPSHP